jgi:hypothetical protein
MEPLAWVEILGSCLGRSVWPFMPVVSLATLAILALAWWS